jgi:hypothetical protein
MKYTMDVEVHFVGYLCGKDQMFFVSPVPLQTQNYHNCLSSSLQPTILSSHTCPSFLPSFLPTTLPLRQKLKQSRTAPHVLPCSLRHLPVKDPIKKKGSTLSFHLHHKTLEKQTRNTVGAQCERYVPRIAFDVHPIRADEGACIKELSIVEQPTRDKHGGTFYTCIQ